MKLIVPVAGESSRFPGTRPKWLLTHPNGNMMFFESLLGLDLAEVDEILIGCRTDHAEQFDLADAVARQFREGGIHLPYQLLALSPTRSQPETVARMLRTAGVSGPIFIKDSDTYITTRPRPGNLICTRNLNEVSRMDASSKSYAEMDAAGIITNIAEKKIVSSNFCVGGYGFADASAFLDAFDALPDIQSPYISHVVCQMIGQGALFRSQEVGIFYDWGTLRDWNSYKKRFATIFVDLDGALLSHSSEFLNPRWGETSKLTNNVRKINQLFESGTVKVIITTSRKESFRRLTLELLDTAGLKFHQILFDLPHAQKILVSNFGPSHPFPAASAINLTRDSDELELFLEAMIERVS